MPMDYDRLQNGLRFLFFSSVVGIHVRIVQLIISFMQEISIVQMPRSTTERLQ